MRATCLPVFSQEQPQQQVTAFKEAHGAFQGHTRLPQQQGPQQTKWKFLKGQELLALNAGVFLMLDRGRPRLALTVSTALLKVQACGTLWEGVRWSGFEEVECLEEQPARSPTPWDDHGIVGDDMRFNGKLEGSPLGSVSLKRGDTRKDAEIQNSPQTGPPGTELLARPKWCVVVREPRTILGAPHPRGIWGVGGRP